MNTTTPIPSIAAPLQRRFVVKRFVALLRIDWTERWRSYASFAAVMLVLQALIVGIDTLAIHRDIIPMSLGTQMTCYYGFLWLFLMAFACLVYAPMQRQGAALVILVRPASMLEKWLHGVVLLLVFFPLVYTLVFVLAYAPINAAAAQAEAVRLAAQVTPNGSTKVEPIGFHLFIPLRPFVDTSREMSVPMAAQVSFIWFIQIIAGFCAFALVQFRRMAAIKALGLALVLFLAILLVQFTVAADSSNTLFNGYDAQGFALWRTWLSFLLFWIVAPVLLWMASFYALRDRELV